METIKEIFIWVVFIVGGFFALASIYLVANKENKRASKGKDTKNEEVTK